MYNKLLNYSETAERLGVRLTTLYSLVYKKRIPHIRLGGRLVRFSSEAIEHWMNNRTVACQDQVQNESIIWRGQYE